MALHFFHCQLRLGLKSRNRAPTARYIKARGKCEAKRSASPLDNRIKCPVALKGRNTHDISALQALSPQAYRNQGRRALLRFALAPGFHIPRLWRSVSTLRAKPPIADSGDYSSAANYH